MHPKELPDAVIRIPAGEHGPEIAAGIVVIPHVADKVGSVSHSDLESIAQLKMDDLNANTLDQAVEMIKGTCVSMGIEIKG